MKDSDKAPAPTWPPLGLTVAEAAEVLRCDRKAILTAISEKGLPAVKVGRGFRIDYDALKAWVARGQQQDAYAPESDAEAPGEDA